MTRVHNALQSETAIYNIPPQILPAALGSSLAHRNSLPQGYTMGSSGTLPSPIGVPSVNSTHSYHPAYSPYNGCPIPIPAAAPFNPAPFVSMPPISYPENALNDDPTSTTVFVAGLPPCITEEALKTFFQNFGEIAYVKIPPNKGYGFVKYNKREDAKQAIIKMNDFPIHEKSRIRLSWGRSLGDKKVEYVKKLSSTLGISFESVWKIVQGQDPAAIKQIVSTVCGRSVGQPYEPSSLSPTNGLDQLHHVENYFSEFTPAVQSNASSIHAFPSGLSNRTIPGLTARTEAANFPITHDAAATGELTEGFRQRSTPSGKLETSLPFNSRPKALSQGSGSASLPPPSWAMRHSWQELFPSEKISQPVESPTSSVEGIRYPEVSTSRRATIPSAKSFTFPYDHMPSTQFSHARSPGSALLSSSQASSMDSLDASSFEVNHTVKENIPIVREKEEYHLGCDEFLHELLEGEGPKGVPFDHQPSGFQKSDSCHFPAEATVPDLYMWSAPSIAKSSPLSEKDGSDWARTFLGSQSTSEIQTVKNIFDSAFETSNQLHQTRETDDCRNDTPSTRLDTWSFPSYAGHASRITKSQLADPPPKLSPVLDTGIKLLDNFYTLSL
ncbi:hypothetical protein PCANC_08786 [Puccinia coronata f. sp. avenae]|uniref:RRM domain-containing protein n=1 Tax=Puccinia coronata f. sp. avenae TaxID=200324 RepID=A0A2N5V896_9BASI|nr:hypothetical protein PCASD_07046 [Puccinia coronata f. sp. avenae]PLW46219.1 hypothetical protein PCANC_08786 [Puccinia coronata f. sp. avenae]